MTSRKIDPPADADASVMDTISVKEHCIDGDITHDLKIDKILTVILLEDGLIDVIFKIIEEDAFGLPVPGIRIGEADIEELLCALGWHPLVQGNEHIPFLVHRRKADAAS